MCKDKAAASAWNPRRRTKSAASSATATATTTSSSKHKPSSSSAASSTISSATVLESLSDRPVVYSFAEIVSATNNFLLKRHSSSSSSSSWRCTLRDKDVLIFQRDSRHRRGGNLSVEESLSIVCRSHHKSLVRLLGACSLPAGDSIFIVYEFVPGANLVDCLRNPRNPSYTVLPTWTARMQVVTDISKGLEYIHRDSGTRRGRGNAVHNRIKSSSILVLDRPQIAAMICHSGTAELTGEIEIEIENDDDEADFKRTYRPGRRIHGTRGYMAPELIAGEFPTQKTDVYAFGVVALELLSGEEPIRFRCDRSDRRKMESLSLIDTAREVLGAEEGDWDEEERRRRVRRWVDRRLKDSFPVDVAVRAVELAVECVGTEPESRPGMEKVAGEMMRLLIKSMEWDSKTKIPTDFTMSLGPR